MNELPQRLLKIVEVAEILQVSRTTVYRLAQIGELPCVRFAGATVRVRAEDLERYISEHLREAAEV